MLLVRCGTSRRHCDNIAGGLETAIRQEDEEEGKHSDLRIYTWSMGVGTLCSVE
jgi:hypothetical protein